MTQAIWLMNFIYGLKVFDFISRSINIYYDNSAIVFFFKNNKSGSQNKNIDRLFYYEKEDKGI
jgi:hypothetical protein